MTPALLAALNLAVAATPATQAISAGPLSLNVVTSDGADVFHVVDQLSQWNPFSHRQYRRYFESPDGGGLSDEEKQLLDAHAEIRKRLGYGVLDATFYSDAGWEQSLAAALKTKTLSATDAATEKKVLGHFAPRVLKLVDAQRDSVRAAVTGLVVDAPKMKVIAEQASHFWGGSTVEMPIYLVVTPSGGGGGGFNGGKLVVEVGKSQVPTPVAIHESWHAFSAAQKSAIQNAAQQAGTDETTISEAMAYTVSPGLYFTGTTSDLDGQVQQDFKSNASFFTEPYVRFNRLGLALRPLMKDALASGETFTTFLPKVVSTYRSLAALADAVERQPSRRRYFCFGDVDAAKELGKEISARRFDVWIRRLEEKDFEALKSTMRRSDTVVWVGARKTLLAAAASLQVVWGNQWPELRDALEQTPRGEFRVMTDQGPRLAVWADDTASLGQAISGTDFRKLLFVDSPAQSDSGTQTNEAP